jgi:hypothetical protein
MVFGRALARLISDWSAAFGKAFEGFWVKTTKKVIGPLALLAALFQSRTSFGRRSM